MYQIGIDIGGTSMKIGLVSDALEIVARGSVPFHPLGGEGVARELAEAVNAVLKQANVAASELDSIGIVIPGSIDPSGESIIDAYNLDFHNVPFRGMVAKYFPGTPVLMANDANGAALAEVYKGAFVGCKTAVLMTLGTGVGGGIILGGRMFNGGMNQGVELGHAYLVDGGEPCTCGNRGCIESYCSATYMIHQAQKAIARYPESGLSQAVDGDAEKMTAKIVTDCARQGDPTAMAVFEDYIGHLSSACAGIFNILDPEVLALGGGLSGAGDFLFKPLRTLIDEKCFYKTHGKVVPAVLGNDAGIIGAAMLRRDAQLGA